MNKINNALRKISSDIIQVKKGIEFRREMISEINEKIDNMELYSISYNKYNELKQEKEQYEREIENFDFYITGLETSREIFMEGLE